jgi:hypothetical protein
MSQAPSPKDSDNGGARSLDGWELALILAVVLGVLLAIAWPFTRSLARRLEPPPIDPDLLGRLDRLEGGLHQLGTLEDRVAELEERLDFALRLLPRPETPKEREAAPPTQELRSSD